MPLKVLMVCLGNICRSPMAHGLLQHKVTKLKLDWEIDSAGTSNYHEGQLADSRAITCMKRHGIDITYQRSRPVVAKDLAYYDHILVMDRSNMNNVLKLAKSANEHLKVALIMDLTKGEYANEVPDPYYGSGDSGFELVYKMLDAATDVLIAQHALNS